MPLLATAQTLGTELREQALPLGASRADLHDVRRTFAGDPLDAIGDLSTVQNGLCSVAQPAFYDKGVADIEGHGTETAILHVKVAYVKR